MLHKLKLRSLLLVGFASVILIFLIVSVVSIQKMNALSELTDKMYRHPFTVTSSVLSIERDVIAIHRNMKDIALTNDRSDITKYSEKIAILEDQINDNFSVVEDRFLGDPTLVSTAFNDFKNWKSIRDKVIQLMNSTEPESGSMAIKITKNEGADQVKKLTNSISALREYAANKAITFNNNATAEKKSAFTLIYWLLGFALIISVIMANLITQNVKKQLGCDPSEAAKIVKEFSKGNLDIKFHTTNKEIGLYKDIHLMVMTLTEMVKNIKNISDDLASASIQVSNTAKELAHGANEQASTVEEISSTMEQMAANISLNDENTQKTKEISVSAEEGIKIVNVQAQKSIDANRLIADKIKIISEITRQTNLLSLNASVEAAAAGDSGRGFAVIALEIRKLAERTRTASAEIIEITQNGYQVSQETGEKLNEMLPDIEKTTQLIQEIAVANGEHNHGTTQVNQAIQQLNTVSQSSATSGEQLAANSQQMSDQARYLSSLIKFFKVDGAV